MSFLDLGVVAYFFCGFVKSIYSPRAKGAGEDRELSDVGRLWCPTKERLDSVCATRTTMSSFGSIFVAPSADGPFIEP